MDDVSGAEVKSENKTKRKMKTAAQLELLEKTYAGESYPSEPVRAELSAKLGLSDRQLQMWFCHRRLKDRKPPPVKKPRKDGAAALVKASQVPAMAPPAVGLSSHEPGFGEMGNDSQSFSGSGSSPFNRVELCRALPGSGGGVARIGGDMATIGRCYEPQHSVLARTAIASVEAQLGGPLREDGPVLGIEFDPLPPDAFGAPIVPTGQHMQAERFYERNLFDHSGPKPIKGSAGVLHEYQFLPEQPSVKSDNYGRVTPPCYYTSALDISAPKTALSMGHSYFHGNEQIPSGYMFHNRISSLNLPNQQNHQGHLFTPVPQNDVTRTNSLTNVSVGAPSGIHPVITHDNHYSPFNMRILNDDDVSRIEKKRKGEEARIAKEIVAHEKRIQKELEKQELLRRKREEQMRKEVERHDRERRKEEERVLREKQREVERYEREQRRELERQEKFLHRESLRAEKMRQKEELRREKEAAKIKAANDRAIARRISKESTELIEDERLELMELAVLNKGLPSIMSIDGETLRNLDLFRDTLTTFPPKSVQLKRPFASRPWDCSDENVGNLLMGWRFLIDFADVLGLWPFTLDEFIQALHDYESRLLGEIHIALLRCIIQDIEDVSRVPCVSMGGGPSSAANSAGGHPRIVEGAYIWGFDICCWQRHLNSLTWPEILRQIALSAGFGPKLKTRVSEHPLLSDDHDVEDGENVVYKLRSGVAAENAAALMQERGYTSSRSRHKLTPGTVKYAAFHVLSIEGSRGLTILEVADRIQKSGLRDLSTSKTPEASIAAALSRDIKLFERTAPSTYCVRSPYRKDPSDKDSILATARERVQAFKNDVVFDGEETYDVDKGEDSESDATEADDFDPETSNAKPLLENQRDIDMKMCTPVDDLFGGQVDLNLASDENCEDDNNDSDLGEEWVQALTTGEYTGLSIEDRLNVIVCLVGLVLEGTSIRNVLEDRLEAANALKKQMWADAQIDKRRVKEEYVTKIQNPSFFDMTDNSIPPEKMEDSSSVPETCPKPVFCTEKLRTQLKSYIGQKAEVMNVYRSLPLGQDRRRNRYWHFATSLSLNDPGCGRIFVEMQNGVWRVIDSEEDFDALLGSLDARGLRESHLCTMLQKIEIAFRGSVHRAGITCPVDDSRKPDVEGCDALGQYLECVNWVWREFGNSLVGNSGLERCKRVLDICHFCRDVYIYEDEHCPSCHRSYPRSDFATHCMECERTAGLDDHLMESVRGRVNMIKALLALVEVYVVSDALQPFWGDDSRKTWGRKLYNASYPRDLLEMMEALESAVKREFLAPNYATITELLNVSSQSKCCLACEMGPQWIPGSTAAAALWIMELKAAIRSSPNQEADLNGDGFTVSYAAMEPVGGPDGGGDIEKEMWISTGNGRGRGIRGRARGRGRCSRVGTGKGQACGRGGRQRGCNVGIQDRPKKIVWEYPEVKLSPERIVEEAPVSEMEWGGEGMPTDTSSGGSQFHDDDDDVMRHASGDDGVGYGDGEEYAVVRGEEMDGESMTGSDEYDEVDCGDDIGIVDKYADSWLDEHNRDEDEHVDVFLGDDRFSSSECSE